MSKLDHFKQFMKQREAAAQEYVCGNSAEVAGLTTHASPSTFFGPQGGVIEGAENVLHAFNQGAAMFMPGSTTHFDILHMDASDNLAYWVGVQRAVAKIHGNENDVAMNLRITEIFRYENNDWKLIHRHADMLAGDAKNG